MIIIIKQPIPIIHPISRCNAESTKSEQKKKLKAVRIQKKNLLSICFE